MQTTIPVCSLEHFTTNSQSLWMADFDAFLTQTNLVSSAHLQHYYVVLYVEKAQGAIAIDGDYFPVDGKQVFVLLPGCIVGYHLKGEVSAKVILFNESFFSLRYNNNVLTQFSFIRDRSTCIQLSIKEERKWNVFLEYLVEEYHNPFAKNTTVLRSYLNILLFHLERNNIQVVKQKKSTVQTSRYKSFQNLVNEHFIEKKLPNEYADLLHMSPNYLNRICKAEVGKTAGEVIRDRVVLEAKRMLHYTFDHVSEIAYALGFENVPYFVTFFKRCEGMTPEEFRRRQAE